MLLVCALWRLKIRVFALLSIKLIQNSSWQTSNGWRRSESPAEYLVCSSSSTPKLHLRAYDSCNPSLKSRGASSPDLTRAEDELAAQTHITMAASADEEIVVSTATVGSANVGKTTMVSAIARGAVLPEGATPSGSTVGVETMCVRITADDKKFKHNVFDTAGTFGTRDARPCGVQTAFWTPVQVSKTTRTRFPHGFSMRCCPDCRHHWCCLCNALPGTAGQERFRAITSTFLRGKDVIIATYSLADLDSIRSIHETWLPMCLDHCQEHTLFVLIGNKLDLVPTGLTAADLGTAEAGTSSSAAPTFSGALVGDGRPEALVEALRTMRAEVDAQLSGHAVAPLFFETSATRGDNLSESMAAISLAVVQERVDGKRDLRTGSIGPASTVALDATREGLLGWGFCGL